MKNIQTQTSKWVKEGLITPEQAAKLIAYEQSSASRSWVNYGVMGIGIIAILTGIISIIAANWYFIPATTKLLCYFALQGFLAFLIIRDKGNSPIVREGLILAFNLLVLGGIALISQIFNLRGEGWRALLLWILLTLPLMYQAKWQLTAHLWMFAATLTGMIWAFSRSSENIQLTSRFLFIGGFAYLFAAMPLLKQLRLPLHILKPMQVWSYLYLLGWITVFANMSWAMNHYSHHQDFISPTHLLFFIGSVTIFGVAALSSGRSKQFCWTLGGMGIFLAIFTIIPITLRVNGLSLVGAVGSITIWGLAAAAAAFDNQQKLFNLASAAIAIRFIVIYFEIFGSLAATGIGLIISGAIILLVAYAWNKVRKSIFLLLEPK